MASQRSGLNIIESWPHVRELVLMDSHEIVTILTEDKRRQIKAHIQEGRAASHRAEFNY